MAKVKVLGEAIVITAGVTLEDIKTVKKYRPEALRVMGGKDDKELMFSIDTAVSFGEINKYGATFAHESHDAEKKATITMPLGEVKGDITEYVADMLGSAIEYLNAIEERFPAVLDEIAEKKAEIMSNIEIVH